MDFYFNSGIIGFIPWPGVVSFVRKLFCGSRRSIIGFARVISYLLSVVFKSYRVRCDALAVRQRVK